MLNAKIKKIISLLFLTLFVNCISLRLCALAPNSGIDFLGQNNEELPIYPANSIIQPGELVSRDELKGHFLKRADVLVSEVYLDKWLEEMEESRQLFRYYRSRNGILEELFEVNDPLELQNQLKIKVNKGKSFIIARIDQSQKDDPLFKDIILDEDSPHLYFEKIFRSLRLHEKKQRSLRDGLVTAREKTLFAELYSFVIDNYYEGKDDDTRLRVVKGLKAASRMAAHNSTYSGVIAGFLSVFPSAGQQEMLEFFNVRTRSKEKIEEKLELAEKISSIPFIYDEKNPTGFQNYLLMLVQMCSNKSGSVDPDIPLIALGKLLELSENKKDGRFLKKYKVMLHNALSFAQMLGLHDVANEIQDLLFKNEEPVEYKRFLKKIKKYFGMSYDDLIDYQQTHIIPRIKKAMDDIGETGYQLKFRLKTPYSLWKKIMRSAKKYTGKTYDSKDQKQFNQIMDSLFDVFGFQVIFDFSSPFWEESVKHQEISEDGRSLTENKLVDKQERIIAAIEKEFAEEKKEEDVFEVKRKWFSEYGYQEFKILPYWKSKSDRKKKKKKYKTFRAEIQVLSDKDYAIYRYGKKAHWIYKLKNDGHEFNFKLLDNLEGVLKGDYRSDFLKLHNVISDEVYYQVEYKKNSSTKRMFLRMPKGAIAADAASSRRIRSFNEKYLGAYTVKRKMKLFADSSNRDVYQYKEDDEAVQPGECLAFNVDGSQQNEIFTNDKRLEAILNNAKKVRTHLLAQLSKEGLEYGDSAINKKGKEIFKKNLNSLRELESIIRLDRKDIGFIKKTFDSDFASELTDFLWLDTKEELFTLFYLLDKLNPMQNDRLIMHIGEHLLRQRLNIPDILSSVSELREILKIDKKETDLNMMTRILSARIIGKIIMERKLKMAMPQKHFNEKSVDGSIRVKLKYAAEALGLESYSQLLTKVGLGLVSMDSIEMLFSKAERFFFDMEIQIDPKSREIDNNILAALESLKIDYSLEEGFSRDENFFRLKVAIPLVGDGYSFKEYSPDSTMINRLKKNIESLEGVKKITGLNNFYFDKSVNINVKSTSVNSFNIKRELMTILPYELFAPILSSSTGKKRTIFQTKIPAKMTPYKFKKLLISRLREKDPSWLEPELSKLVTVKENKRRGSYTININTYM